jgi:hypothetical protein
MQQQRVIYDCLNGARPSTDGTFLRMKLVDVYQHFCAQAATLWCKSFDKIGPVVLQEQLQQYFETTTRRTPAWTMTAEVFARDIQEGLQALGNFRATETGSTNRNSISSVPSTSASGFISTEVSTSGTKTDTTFSLSSGRHLPSSGHPSSTSTSSSGQNPAQKCMDVGPMTFESPRPFWVASQAGGQMRRFAVVARASWLANPQRNSVIMCFTIGDSDTTTVEHQSRIYDGLNEDR